MVIESSITTRSMLIMKARHQNQGNWYSRLWKGDSLYRETGEWNRLERVINRGTDVYYEKITDPRTGKVLREVGERLSEHKDRGSARRRSG